MITWVKTGKEISPEGTTIIYTGVGTDLIIESRKRHIPHAAKGGTWDHTTYWVLHNGVEVKQLYRFKEAKEFAEKYQEAIND